MNLKALKEQRNKLLTEVEEIMKEVEVENRSLESTEFDAVTEKTARIEQLDKEIEVLEKRHLDGTKIKEGVESEMENKEKEIRGLELYLRKQDGDEVRELNKTDDGGAVIPENVEGSVIKKMEESAPVFALARKFPSVAGSLKIAKEDANTTAGFVGEGENLTEGKVGFKEVKLTQKRVGAALTLSTQLVNDSAVDIVGYSLDLLSRRTAKAIEKSILIGEKEEEFRGIVHDEEIATVEADAVTVDTLMDLYNAIHPEFLDSSVFIMSRKFFNEVAKLKDGNGHFYMQNGVVNGKLTYTLFGAIVIVTDALEGDVPAIFGNVTEAYGVMIKKGLALQHVSGDTTQALRGSHLLLLDGYMDGAVYNPQALAKLKTAGGVVVEG